MSRRTRERKLREEAERAAEKKRHRRTAPLRLLKRLAKVLIGGVFVGYLGMATPMAWNWYMTKVTRLADVSRVDSIARADLQRPNPDPDDLRIWLSRRPISDGEQLMKRLEPYIGQMSGQTFLLYAGWEANAGKIDDAVFWRQYARFRIRYDVLRCGSYDAVETVAKIMNDLPQEDVKKRMMETPQNLPKEIKQVLDFDRAHPPVNDPAQFCAALAKLEEFRDRIKIKMVSPSQWPIIYSTLRGVTYLEMLKIENEQKSDAAATPPGGNTAPDSPPKAAPCPASGKLPGGRPCAGAGKPAKR